MRLLWTAKVFGLGNGYGYFSHATQMQKALETAGVTLCYDPSESYDLAVYIAPPDFFRPIAGKKNLLFTMFETSPLPKFLQNLETVKTAIALVVPCRFCEKEFRRWYNLPIHICPEGIDPAIFPFHQRSTPSPRERFRFLFVGAWNPRKGYHIVEVAWKKWLASGSMPANVELYFKTSGLENEGVEHFRVARSEDGLGFYAAEDLLPGPPLPAITMDSRNLQVDEMSKLYNSAHVFLSPSLGEGWNLPLGEAMATGCPNIFTNWSSPRDYADETTGYPLKFSMIRAFKSAGKYQDPYGDTETEAGCAWPDINHLVQRMKQAYYGYQRALRLGKAAS